MLRDQEAYRLEALKGQPDGEPVLSRMPRAPLEHGLRIGELGRLEGRFEELPDVRELEGRRVLHPDSPHPRLTHAPAWLPRKRAPAAPSET